MKYCSKCGSPNEVNAEFCVKCGNNLMGVNQVEQVVNNQQPIASTTQPMSNSNKKTLNYASIAMICGVVSIIGGILVTFFMLPVVIVGVICAKKAYDQDKKPIGFIINGIALLVIIGVFIFNLTMLNNNPFYGKWECGNGTRPTVNFEVGIDKKFKWADIDNSDTNYVTGNITVESIENGKYRLTLDGETYVVNGEVQTEKYKSGYEVSFANGNIGMAMLNWTTGALFHCEKK